MTECSSHETHNIYPNLNSLSLKAVPMNDQQVYQIKLMKLKIILLNRLEKEN